MYTTWDFGHIVMWIIIVAGIVAIGSIVLRRLGINLPDWLWQILMVIGLVVVGVLAIKFLMTII